MQKNVEKMTVNYSPNFDLKKRDKSKIKYLIYQEHKNLNIQRLSFHAGDVQEAA